ncbi:MAG TPA: metallophosphoesterase [Bradyrhizobium sp.]
MARIAHISDIHFGRTFNVDVWNKTRDEIVGFHPSIIVASGDFTDHPDPLLLLAAKSELEDLSARCGADTQFFVVPGNHDLLDFGNVPHPGSVTWFNRVMFHDTTNLRNNLQSRLSFKLGLNEETRRWANFPRFTRMKPRNWLWVETWTDKCDGRLQSCDYRRAGKRWPTQSIHDQTLVVCLDSNYSALRQLVFATGTVAKNQIDRIGSPSPLASCTCCGLRPNGGTADGGILLRIAVLHHHPLPIAVRDKSLDDQVSEARLEPFLILKNGGDLIHELQRQRFDLILHGHKHRPQFARVELRADDPERYPILVLAGGSTAKADEARSDNTLRDIGTAPNGQLTVRTFEQGDLKEDRDYREPMEVLKQRAFARAVERTKISAKEWFSEVAIDGVGHLRSLDQTSELRVRRRDMTLPGIVSHVVLPSHDTRLDIHVERGNDKVSLCSRDDSGTCYGLDDPHRPQECFYWLNFEDPLKSGSPPLTFAIREAAANSIAMSQWEIDERSHHKGAAGNPDFGYEEVGSRISYPVEKLIVRLEFPAELVGITPKVRCRRHPATPNFPLRYLPEQRPSGPEPKLLTDGELAKEETRRLTYSAENSTWVLEVDHPIPGYTYSLQWRVPDPRAHSKVADRTIVYRQLLARILSGSCPDEVIRECQLHFEELARNLMERFHSGIDSHERQTAFLMLYDSEDLCLRPALRYSNGTIPAGSYQVPLGGGVAGAAFLQRKIIAWKNDPNSKSLIKPASSGALNSHWVLALPVFHEGGPDGSGDELDTQPGAVIGVVTLGSNNAASRICDCEPNEKDPDDKTGEKLGQDAQKLAQDYIFDILDILGEAPVAAEPRVP